MSTNIVNIATAWGSKSGGINSFSTRLCKALPLVLKETNVIVVVNTATESEKVDAFQKGVTLVSLDYNGNDKNFKIEELIFDKLKQYNISNIEWWIGHDNKTGGIANKCRNKYGGKTAIFMHMSFSDYGYVKHGNKNELEIAKRVKEQKDIFSKADIKLAVGPLLKERMQELTGNSENVIMVVPGLSDVNTKSRKDNRLSLISFGRFDSDEFLTKQSLLAVKGYALANKRGHEGFIKALIDSEMTIVGAADEVADKMKGIANEVSERVVNLKLFPYVEDEDLLDNLLDDSNLCLMLSWHEGFGLTAWEAISNGIPVLISRNSGVYKLLEQFGGSALGNISSVDIKGKSEGLPNDEDVENVCKEIVRIANSLKTSLKNAQSLKNLLLNKDFTWQKCAENFARVLSLNLTDSFIMLFTEAQENTNEFVVAFEKIDLSNVYHLLEISRSYYKIGNYQEAVGILDEIRQNKETIRKSYSLLVDASILECEIRLRLNEYISARNLLKQILAFTKSKQDWEKYVEAGFIENTILRDQGQYEDSVKLAEELLAIVNEYNLSESITESAKRKLSRSLSLYGEWPRALELAQEVLESSKNRGHINGDEKAHLALGEAYRHGLDFINAKESYKKSFEISLKNSNVDCFLWAKLGFLDCLFLLDENPLQQLQEVLDFIDKTPNSYPLEKLHFQLLEYSSKLKFLKYKNPSKDFLANYERLGIFWPNEYLVLINQNDYSKPKKF